MKDSPDSANHRIARRVKALRARARLSLEALAESSGVSRSMISLVERGESSPTAVVLERLATALGVTMAEMFETTAPHPDTSGPISRRRDQREWKDPASGYVRRNVSPASVPQPMQIVEVHFPAGRRVAFESGARDEHVFQQIWLLGGEMTITLGSERHRLRQGDCLAMTLDKPTMFHNTTRKKARYAVVISSGTRGGR